MALDISSSSDADKGEVSIRCAPILKSSRTNTWWLYSPPLESRIQMELRDDGGRLIPKTMKGKALGKPLMEPFRDSRGVNYKAGYTGQPLFHNQSELVVGASEFTLQDYFAITNPGKYRLKFEMNVIWFPPGWKGNSKSTNVPLVSLPPVYADLDVKPENIRKQDARR